jgi:hypothetical protein
VAALAVSGGRLYAGGDFTGAGGVPANNIAQWDGSGWSPLGTGMNNQVYALAVSGGLLYVGGWFTTAGGSPANCIAQWNGSSWSALGSGLNQPVKTLAVSGGALYAGGDFTTAGTNVSASAALAVLGAPVIFGNPALSPTDGSLTLNLASSANSSSEVWMATNLTPPVAWQSIYTNLNGGLWQFTDTNTADFGAKFYRVSTP